MQSKGEFVKGPFSILMNVCDFKVLFLFQNWPLDPGTNGIVVRYSCVSNEDEFVSFMDHLSSCIRTIRLILLNVVPSFGHHSFGSIFLFELWYLQSEPCSRVYWDSKKLSILGLQELPYS